jgi:hypothetical protein
MGSFASAKGVEAHDEILIDDEFLNAHEID